MSFLTDVVTFLLSMPEATSAVFALLAVALAGRADARSSHYLPDVARGRVVVKPRETKCTEHTALQPVATPVVTIASEIAALPRETATRGDQC